MPARLSLASARRKLAFFFRLVFSLGLLGIAAIVLRAIPTIAAAAQPRSCAVGTTTTVLRVVVVVFFGPPLPLLPPHGDVESAKAKTSIGHGMLYCINYKKTHKPTLLDVFPSPFLVSERWNGQSEMWKGIVVCFWASSPQMFLLFCKICPFALLRASS